MTPTISLVALLACGGTDPTADTAPTASGSSPGCAAVWDVPFRSEASQTCYGYSSYTSTTAPQCYHCATIRQDETFYLEGDVIEITEDPVSCATGTFTQNGQIIATYDETTAILSWNAGNGIQRFVLDDIGACPDQW